jgi:hypothetical protein
MAKLTRYQTSFEFGEISPRLLARVDLAAYSKATKTEENAYSLVHGGATKRRGTMYVGAVKTEAQAGRLIPFVYSTSRKFVLVFNGGKIQFLKDRAYVETSPGTRYELTVPYTEAELEDVQYAQSGNTMYLVHPNYFPKLLQRVSDTSWTLTDIPFTYNAVSDVTFSNAFITFKIINGSDVFQEGEYFTIATTAGAITTITGPVNGLTVKTPVTVATTENLAALTGLLTIDGRVLVAGDRVLVKDQTTAADDGIYVAAAGAWTRATDMDTAAECNGAYVQVIDGTVNSDNYWKQTATIATLGTTAHVWVEASAVGNGQIAGVASMPGSTTTETWTITCTFSSSARQEWSVTGSVSGDAIAYWKADNYPQTVSFFEQRLFFGGSTQFPQHIWGSAAGDYLNFTVGNKDSDGVIVQIAGNDYNAITHMVSARSLMPLTTSTEFSMAGPNNFAISGISSNVIKDHTRNGSNNVKPLRIGREVAFLQRDGKKMRAISYSVTEDANVAPDITIFAEHLTRSATFVDMAFASDPDYIAWIVRSDGVLCSLTLAREFETTAWSRHTTNGLFESVGTVPGTGSDDVYFIVNRTVNGATRRYIEYFDYEDVDTVYSDCSAIYDGVATSSITGLSHLEGMTVTALVKEDSTSVYGVVHPNMVVTGGTVTLEYPVEYATIGLPYTTTLELLDPEFGDASQSTAAKAKSVVDILIKFQDTVNANINGVAIPFRNAGDLLNQSVIPFTGDKRVKNLGWRSPNNILITNDTPTGFAVLGVVIEAAVN